MSSAGAPKGGAVRMLFLCTGNSACSQIAEAVLNRKSGGRFVAESAGSQAAEARARASDRAIGGTTADEALRPRS